MTYNRADKSGSSVSAMKLMGALVLAGAMTFVGPPETAIGCSCSWNPLSEFADDLEAAFVGRQIESRYDGDAAVLTLEVDRVYKGEVGPVVEVRSHSSGATCGHSFGRLGLTAVVVRLAEESTGWADLSAGDLYVGYCDSHVSIGDLEEVFGSSYPPDTAIQLPEPQSSEPHVPERPDPHTTLRRTVTSGIALVVLAAGLIAMRRRRRAGR